jgi:hypothetical protein
MSKKDQLRGQEPKRPKNGAQSVRAKSAGHKKKTADKWNQ